MSIPYRQDTRIDQIAYLRYIHIVPYTHMEYRMDFINEPKLLVALVSLLEYASTLHMPKKLSVPTQGELLTSAITFYGTLKSWQERANEDSEKIAERIRWNMSRSFWSEYKNSVLLTNTSRQKIENILNEREHFWLTDISNIVIAGISLQLLHDWENCVKQMNAEIKSRFAKTRLAMIDSWKFPPMLAALLRENYTDTTHDACDVELLETYENAVRFLIESEQLPKSDLYIEKEVRAGCAKPYSWFDLLRLVTKGKKINILTEDERGYIVAYRILRNSFWQSELAITYVTNKNALIHQYSREIACRFLENCDAISLLASCKKEMQEHEIYRTQFIAQMSEAVQPT